MMQELQGRITVSGHVEMCHKYGFFFTFNEDIGQKKRFKKNKTDNEVYVVCKRAHEASATNVP